MDWIEVTIDTTHEGMDAVGGLLDFMGFEGYIIEDEEDFQSFLRENTMYWDYVDKELYESMRGLSRIKLYVEASQSEQKLKELADALNTLKTQTEANLGSLRLHFGEVASQDWENAWKQYYQPIQIGERLLINPQWLEPESSDRVVVSLDPGMMFGTGSHASTRMCLEALERHIKGGETVLDLGSGSGILSIAALKLGAKEALGVDIDPKAEKIARENAGRNGLFSDRFQAVTGDVMTGGEALLSGGKYDIILANIVADVIMPLAPKAMELLSAGGRFICSGILNTRRSEVEKAIKQAGFNIDETDEQEDWIMMSGIIQ